MAAMATATLQNFMMNMTDGNRGADIDYISSRSVDEIGWTATLFGLYIVDVHVAHG
jgi:hypothetical protein